MRRRAFTLIELLVVVSIIAVLISILLPALGRAREQGKAVACASNLRMLGVAVTMYADANRGWFPQWGFAHGGGGAGVTHSWLARMGPQYADARGVLTCPSDRSSLWRSPSPTGALRQTSYATNYYLVEENTALTARDGHPYNRMDWVRKPASTIFFCELVETGEFALSDHVHPEQWDFFYPQEKREAAKQVALERHLKQANYALLDGHAERLTFEQTFSIDGASSTAHELRWFFNKYDPTVAR